MTNRKVYQFYAELDDFEPKIWRRFQVADDITVAQLGYIIQVLFEMTASHLMVLEVPKEDNVIWRYEISDDDLQAYSDSNCNIKVNDAAQSRLYDVLSKPNDIINFNYDFGDDWWVLLKLEHIFSDQELPDTKLPHVLAGDGLGIVEDVGGTAGLQDLVKAFRKKQGRKYQEFREWLGIEDFDITSFDLNDINLRIKTIPSVYQQYYEDR